MQRRTASLLVFSLILLGPAAASAQERGQAGLAMGYPAVGLMWHVTDDIALRPDVAVSKGSTTSTSGFSTDSWSVGVGLSALFYVARWDSLRAYVSPHVAYTKSKSSTETGSPILPSIETTGSSYGVAGSFGTQYSLSRRFSVFGEVGLSYSHGRTSGSLCATLHPGGRTCVRAAPSSSRAAF
jgi:hypothetical protein